MQPNEAVLGPSTSVTGRRRFKVAGRAVEQFPGKEKLSSVAGGIRVKEKGGGDKRDGGTEFLESGSDVLLLSVSSGQEAGLKDIDSINGVGGMAASGPRS